MVGEHRLVPCDAQLQLRVVLGYPVQHLHHPRPIVGVVDGRQELVERLDCHTFTLGSQRADQPHFVRCLLTWRETRGPPVVFGGRPQAELPKEGYMSQKRRSCEWLMC